MAQEQFETYQPTPEDIRWARYMMSHLKNGGVLGYPATKAIYVVDHFARTITLQNVDEILKGPDAYIHYRGIAVFDRIGYKMLPEAKPNVRD